jgi:hypothetical protein
MRVRAALEDQIEKYPDDTDASSCGGGWRADPDGDAVNYLNC